MEIARSRLWAPDNANCNLYPPPTLVTCKQSKATKTKKYSRRPLYGHRLDADTSLAPTISYVPEEALTDFLKILPA